MSPVLSRPSRAPRSPQESRERQPPGWGKAPRRRESRPEHRERPDRTRRGAPRGATRHAREATPPTTTQAHGQVPSSDGRQVQQTRRARTARNQPQHEDRCLATPAAVRTDVCAPGSEPSPCRLRNSRHPDDMCAPGGHSQRTAATNSHRPDGRVHARRVPSHCRLRIATIRTDESAPRSDAPHTQPTAQHTERAHRRTGAKWARTPHSTPGERTGEQEPRGPGHRTSNTTHRAGTPANRSQGPQDTAQATQHSERADRWTGATWPRTPHTQNNAAGGHTGERERNGPGHRTSKTTHQAGTPLNRSQVA